MGIGYRVHCLACRLDRHVLLGQGDDAFYEFCEDALFYCEDCRDLGVVTVPIGSEDLQLMLEGDFGKPWSKLTAGDTPEVRRRNAEEELVKSLVGYYDHPECPRCGGETSTDREMLWE